MSLTGTWHAVGGKDMGCPTVKESKSANITAEMMNPGVIVHVIVVTVLEATLACSVPLFSQSLGEESIVWLAFICSVMMIVPRTGTRD